MTKQDKELEEILNAFAVECIKCTEDDYKSKMTIPQATMKLLAWRDKSVNEARLDEVSGITILPDGTLWSLHSDGQTVEQRLPHLNKKGNSND
ncbi:hypothetical protein EKK58_09415 [Candidatus Dependentiae bacterium]|nr:MAG: hypothetical protein EKK58_09415 [Candidatus Dependentiae bacterium]